MIDDPFYEVEDLPPVSLPPASSVRPILIIDSPEIPIVEGADSPCNTPTSTRSNRFSRRSEKGKKVSFTADTVIPKDNNIALSITRHAYTKELGYTKYTIELMFQGIQWTVHKRYRDFDDLNRKVATENEIYQLVLPVLPKKRWFEKQRWLNKYDESYGIKRRMELQDYMRSLAKIDIVREQSFAFRSFISMPEAAQKLMQDQIDEQEGLGAGNVSNPAPTTEKRLQYRNSFLEVDLNVEFDDEGNPVPPTQSTAASHAIFPIVEGEEESTPITEEDASPSVHVEKRVGLDSDDDSGEESPLQPPKAGRGTDSPPTCASLDQEGAIREAATTLSS